MKVVAAIILLSGLAAIVGFAVSLVAGLGFEVVLAAGISQSPIWRMVVLAAVCLFTGVLAGAAAFSEDNK